MKSLLDAIQANSATLVLILGIVCLGLIATLLIFASRLSKMQGLWQQLFAHADGQNIERMMLTHLRDRMEIQERLDGLGASLQDLQERMASAKRFVGLVRYDAFEDVGGAQSFALAVYDERGDGVIMTSVVGRTDCRVYAKPLVRGSSERSLSQEEQRAIASARDARPKTVLSP